MRTPLPEAGFRASGAALCAMVAVPGCTNVIAFETKQTAPALEMASQVSHLLGVGNLYGSPAAQWTAVDHLGVHGCLLDIALPGFYPNGVARPEALDDAVTQAQAHGCEPLVYLAESGSDGPVGDYAKWYAIGAAFGERFRPGGPWASSHGLSSWGVTRYAAIHHPDVDDPALRIPTADYARALEGLADGLHAVDPNILVASGALASPGCCLDYTARGYAQALAPLFNQGKLDGINLSMFYDVEYASLEANHLASAQNRFDKVREASGITRAIGFYASQFNYKKRLVTEQEAAKGLLTGIWDHLAVAEPDGSLATRLAVLFSLDPTTMPPSYYSLDDSLDPWLPTDRGKVVQLVAELTRGLSLTRFAPNGTGEIELTGRDRKLWVFHDRAYWTDHPGAAFDVTNIPAPATTLEVYGWNGLRQTLAVNGQSAMTVNGLAVGETYMFLARP